jgi:hypothetical protein
MADPLPVVDVES